MPPAPRAAALRHFQPAVREWFAASFREPTRAQAKGWAAIAHGDSTLVLAPTGSGKTLAAFLWCLDRLMFTPVPPASERCRVVYVSPLKALAVDVERNLRAPIAGVATVAGARGEGHVRPLVAVRTGDTPAAERARFRREPADILITTPESLYLLLTSSARSSLRSVDTIIIDEIHALVATKRGAHLALSVERLAALCGRPLQRIGLSATARPADEVARFLGGLQAPQPSGRPAPGSRGARRRARADAAPEDVEPDRRIHEEFGTDEAGLAYRDVTVVDATEPKRLDLSVDVPVEDMARIGQLAELPSGPASQGPQRTSIWTAIHPRLLDLIRQHRSTLLFVNSRRVAERLAAALNELAGETLVRSHHGSIAREQRIEIEDRLKAGLLQGLVATSSLELGIDMGAIDLVVQIEAPPSVTSGLQRIGRAGHQVGAASRGVIFPKYRGDLVACAAVTRLMQEGRVESVRYARNPLDVLAQQIVAAVAVEDWRVDDLFELVRRAAPFATLSRTIFEGVLDMLAGRYPSDEFAELRPRVTWDRLAGTLRAREGAQRVAITNAGTIPDRGLYGVFLAGAKTGTARVGELDEEMVFESRVGETFLLGATSWRIEDITHDRVLVTPAPGEPGKMPFWKAEGPGRPLELGRRIGRLAREIGALPVPAAVDRLERNHGLDRRAAENLVEYLADQRRATQVVPDDRTVLIERYRDELGDWRVCVLSPLGGRVLAPWSMAAAARVRDLLGLDVETMWTDDGFVVRFPETDDPPDTGVLLPAAAEVEPLLLRQLGSTALFAAKFREAAGRALLLPKRRPGGRAPLWQQRKRAADLLAVASRFGSFPIILEAYRECLRDQFDLPALVDTLRRIEDRSLRVVTVDATTPSPFASSLLFGYVANYIYEGDAPLAERRAQALAIDQGQLRDLLGDVELRDLLDADAIDAVERHLQHIEPGTRVRSADAVHDLLIRIGDLTTEELGQRTDASIDLGAALGQLARARRLVGVPVSGEQRWLAAEDAARYRDALGVPLPPGLPQAFLEPVRDPRGDLASRYARTHGPFTTIDLAARYGLGRSVADAMLRRLAGTGRVIEGAFRPGGAHREWCDPGVLRQIRRRSLAILRQQAEPVDPPVLGRLLGSWQGVTRRRHGLDALLDVVQSLQGAPLVASLLETQILPARLDDYEPAQLDAVAAAGEVVWCGVDALGERDGRVALYLTDDLPRLWRPAAGQEPVSLEGRDARLVDHLDRHGASFFGPLHEAAGGGYPGETVRALWRLVWQGRVTNDAFSALRAVTRPPARRRRAHPPPAFRSRRSVPAEGEGRWSLVRSRVPQPPSATEWSTATARQLLGRYGLVTREVAAAEWLPGGFAAVYDVLRAMDEAGRVRRGYFVSGVGAVQFALPAALDELRALRDEPDEPQVAVLAASDPANPYGAILRWPVIEDGEPDDRPRLSRSAGAVVVLVNGMLGAYIGRGGRMIAAFLPPDEPARSTVGRAAAGALAGLALLGEGREGGLLVDTINGRPAADHPLAAYLVEAGFVSSAMGFQVRRRRSPAAPPGRRGG